jgi:hypothetical protein
VSHYRLTHAPKRRYLDHGLTIQELFSDYKSKFNNCKKTVYYDAVNDMNIGFAQPDQDKCDVCQNYDTHMKEQDDEAGNHNMDCEICTNAKTHLRNAKLARDAYRLDKVHEAGTTKVCADMQKVILLPKLKTKEHFFVSRLVTFNETFSSLLETADDTTAYCGTKPSRDEKPRMSLPVS